MPTKVSEKKLAIGIACFAAGIFLFSNTPVITAAVRVSEKAVFSSLFAISLIILAIVYIRRSIVKAS